MKEFKDYLNEIGEVGRVQAIIQSIVYVSGLPGVRPNEMLVGEEGQRGIVQSLSGNNVEVLMLDTHNLKHDLALARTNETFKIAASTSLLGRVVNAFGQPIDGAGPITGEKKLQDIYPPAPGISQRVKVNSALETGVTIVDLLVPLGYGQRELIIGDKKTGKTTFLLQTISNQAARGVVCVYVSIGKRQDDVKNIENYLRKSGVINNCVLLVSGSSDPATSVYLSPFSGMALAEYFRDIGKNVLIIFDDMSNHARFYREISLISKRAPGRSSYPGNIFHIQASLLERAGQIKTQSGDIVSITALPVAETLEGDITGYIQTNLMAITDGHIFFDIDEFRKGQRPAINDSLSVSRVGNQTKQQLERQLAQKLREVLSSYKKDLEIAKFGVELPELTRKEIERGEKIELIFNQDTETLISRDLQLFLFGLLFSGFWDNKNTGMVKVDLIKLVEKYKKGELKSLSGQVQKIQTFEELVSFSGKYANSISESLYV